MEQVIRLAQAGKLDDAAAEAMKELAVTRELMGELHEEAISSLDLLARLHEAGGEPAAARKALRGSSRHPRATSGSEGLADRRRSPCPGPCRPAHRDDSGPAAAAPGGGSTERPPGHTLRQGKYWGGNRPVPQGDGDPGRALGEDHPDYATSLNNLAVLYQADGRLRRAEPLYRQAMEICRRRWARTTPTTPRA